jgi:hypothetical protein
MVTSVRPAGDGLNLSSKTRREKMAGSRGPKLSGTGANFTLESSRLPVKYSMALDQKRE